MAAGAKKIETTLPPLRAITVDALWAWAIVYAGKRIENRSWQTHYRGPLAIHAGRGQRRDAQARAFLVKLGIEPPAGDELAALRGNVLGVCRLVDVVKFDPSLGCQIAEEQRKWAVDPQTGRPVAPWCWRLSGVKPLATRVPVLGQQGLWTWQR